jgi:O-antigen ligase
MKPKAPSAPRSLSQRLPSLFAAIFGAFLGSSLLKFGNPPLMEQYVLVPQNGYEFVFGSPWPIAWAYATLACVGVLGLLTATWRRPVPYWLIALPIAWLCWQFLSATTSIDSSITTGVLHHFVACLVCFFLGVFALSRCPRLGPAWLGLGAAFTLVLASGWQQHFGGLEATRQYALQYLYPKIDEIPPEYLKKLMSNRVFSTLFYPNALAGALLLVLPPTLAVVCRTQSLTRPARGFIAAVLAVGAAGCLYWSGSKGGWLLMLLLATIALSRFRFVTHHKVAVITIVLFAGSAGFLFKYASFFQRGATSVGARFDYWQAAAKTALHNPVLGSGPGTFGKAYEKIRPIGSEPARLAHNDYLQQASDSGFPGFVLYGAFIAGALVYSASRLTHQPRSRVVPAGIRKAMVPGPVTENATDWEYFCVWLGVLGWSLQSLIEFDLYIPGLAWPAFACLGWLLGVKNDSTGADHPVSLRSPDENPVSKRT